jgi:hypothetical protein
MQRFAAERYCLHDLRRVERFDRPGYNGRVETACGGAVKALSTTMYLAACHPFTVAHELAHVSDISVRKQETIDHIGAEMPVEWHLSHRMSSEYYANRVACGFVGEEEVFPAFLSDLSGFKNAAAEGDWASLLIYYALLLGLFHGLGRPDCAPLTLLGGAVSLPATVSRGVEAFDLHAPLFFSSYADQSGASLAEATCLCS